MHLAAIWRYPVKSMGGERVEEIDVTSDGLTGDRVLHVRDARGRIVTSRSRPRLLTHRATLGADGEPRIDGRPWMAPSVAADVEQAAGAGAHLAREPACFDVLPLLVTTDGALAALGVDLRRLRPNLVIGGVEGLTERTWEGRRLQIGDAIVECVELRARCIMTTFDPDTATQDVSVLLRIREEYEGTFALDTRVVRPARIAVGAPVVLLPEVHA